MSDNVVNIYGGAIPEKNEPCESVVQLLEELLEGAKKGHVQGFCGVTKEDDGYAFRYMAGYVEGYELQGALNSLSHDLYTFNNVEE